MTKFEYKQEVIPLSDKSQDVLNVLGRDGWEMVTAFQGQAAASPLLPQSAVPVLFCLFKRPQAILAA